MAGKHSAGVVLFRSTGDELEVLLGHMGGPFWARKDEAAWSVPKGEYQPDEETAEQAARREFTEELGLPVPEGELRPLGEVKQSGKTITAWALAADLDPDTVVPGTFDLEWPPRSGNIRQFPELDRVAWFDLAQAREKLVKGQRPFLDRIAELLAG
ncbi:MAG TPA: NUDIX domain-containing protein [Pseudonocardiaceae bacterium]|nr:NUDIX domain-containing protein [Pseudonocardiaceae bacterium]